MGTGDSSLGQVIKQRTPQETTVAYKRTLTTKKGDRKQRASFKNGSVVSDDYQRVICLQHHGDGLSRRNTLLRVADPPDFVVDDQKKLGRHVSWRVGSERDHVGTGSVDCDASVVGV